MDCRVLTALPVYNEAAHAAGAVAGALSYCRDVLVVDDGSTDGVSEMLAGRDDVHLIRHPRNLGYGMAIRTAFDFAIRGGFDVLVTIDCDGQHQPQLIPKFVDCCWNGPADIVSGSRYLRRFPGDSEPPEERRRINEVVTEELNRRLGLNLTDAFCGFKAYRASALAKIELTETGYAMPLELWVCAAQLGLKIVELPVPLIYLDRRRSFGGALDDAETRLAIYRQALDRAERRAVGRTRSCSVQVPQANGETLVEPPAHQVAGMVAANRNARAAWNYDLQGCPLKEVSDAARRGLLDAARRWTSSYRDISASPWPASDTIFLTGHQPQMFHPGVWLKNFVLGSLASEHGATAVHLIVDSDAGGEPALKIPGGSTAEPTLKSMPFDLSERRAKNAVPYEERRIVDRAMFESFGRRAVEHIAPLVRDPLMTRYWPLVLDRAREIGNLGTCLAQARHQLEGLFLVGDDSAKSRGTLEVPMSWLCRGEAFQWFVVHLLAQLPRFHVVYNEAIRAYRRRHRLRSRSHPAPELTVEATWLEAPFWIWTRDDPRRRRLFVQLNGKEIILTDRQGWEKRLPLRAEGDGRRAVEQLLEWQQGDVRIRPRALLTTLWARLALGDLFIHGIGGAKYDEVTDHLINRFFGLRPPEFLVVSGTLRLPIEHGPQACGRDDSVAERENAACELWEMTHHPERFLANVAGGPAKLIAEKRRWIETPATCENARRRCRAIREINAALQPQLEERRRRFLEAQASSRRRLLAERALRWREYAFCLHPESALRTFFSPWLAQPS